MKRAVNIGRASLWLIVALGLMLSLSGGAQARPWIHADGSPCLECSRDAEEKAAADCCSPAAAVELHEHGDCRDCCSPAREERSPQAVGQAHQVLALAADTPVVVAPALVAVRRVPNQEERPTGLPPPLHLSRAPPALSVDWLQHTRVEEDAWILLATTAAAKRDAVASR